MSFSHNLFGALGYSPEPDWEFTLSERSTLAASIPVASIGVYVLWAGRKPIYVGRSDSCLRKRLLKHEHLPVSALVAWRRCPTTTSAYRLERRWYERLAGQPGILNRICPAAPAGVNTIYVG